MAFLKKILGIRFGSFETENSYSEYQSDVQNKLFYPIRIVLFGGLILPIWLSISQRYPLQETLFKHILPCIILLVALFKIRLLKLHNFVFVLVFWIACLHFPPKMLEFYGIEDRIALYFVGYIMGILEVIMAFSIKTTSYRILLQLTFILGKFWNFSEFLRGDPMIKISFCFVSFISILFFSYHSGLDRGNFKTIQDSNTKLQNFHTFLADDFPVGVIITTAGLDDVIYANHFFKQTFNFESDCKISPSSIKKQFKKLIIESEEIKAPDLLDYIESISHKTPSDKFTDNEITNVYVLYKKDENTEHHYEVKIRKILWERNPAYTIILNDVSDKQQLLALEMADQQKDRILATISHELKTPINGIVGLLDIVRSQVNNEKTKTYLDHCQNCSKLLLYFVNSVLDLSLLRRDNLKAEKGSFYLSDLLEELKSLYTFTATQKGITFYFEKANGVPNYIYTDKYRLIEILIQLIGNAIKFTFKGYVRLRVSPDPLNQTQLIFSVEDTGLGIKQENQQGLFSMFGQLNQPKRNINLHGVGFGLSIASGLVKLLNSTEEKKRLYLESEVNKGSRFWFYVEITPELDLGPPSNGSIEDVFEERPASDLQKKGLIHEDSLEALNRDILCHRSDSNASTSPKMQYSDPLKDFSLHQAYKGILIVDDNPFNLMAASHIVTKIGYQASTAASGEECLEALLQSKELEQEYALVLMDIQMPVMDGIETTRLIIQEIKKGKLYPVPVVALTAKLVDSREREIYKEAGMLEALEKPLLEVELRRVITRFSKE